MIRSIRNTVVFILFSFHPCLALEGNNLIDSLLARADKVSPDERVNLLNDISRAYRHISPDQSSRYAGEALELAEFLNDKKGTADALNRLGNAEYFKNNYLESHDYYMRSLLLRIEINDSQGIIDSYNNLYLIHDLLGNPGKAVEYAEKAVELCIKVDDKIQIARYLNMLGSKKSELYEFDDARKSLDRALEIYETLDDNEGIARTMNNLGNLFNRMSLYDKAQECFYRALQLYRESGNLNGIASSNNYIGIIHQQLNHIDIALEYFTLSLEIYSENTGMGRQMASLLNNIGIIWFEKGDYETALDYYNRATESYEIINFQQGLATTNHNLGILYTRMGKYDDALQSYMLSVEINKSRDNNFSLANNYNNLGELYHLRKDYDRALEYLEQALEMAMELNAKNLICENYLFQSNLFRDKNDYGKALEYYELFDEFRDSKITTDAENKVVELQIRNKRENQITELDILQKDNDIQMLRIRKQNTMLLYLGAGVLLTGLFIFVILGIYRYRRRLNLELQEKNRQLELANEELKRSEKNLQRLSATKDKFFSIIAHDLKNPFNALLGFSETLNHDFKELSGEQIRAYIDIINKSATNLYQLLENLLEWSKSQTGNIIYKPEKFFVTEVAESGINTVRVNAERKRIKINKNINPRLTAFADKNIISTVIRNLANNAVKFTHHHGEITISAQKKEKLTEISVSDNGIGIEPAEQKKLFNIGYNITTVGTDDEKGTGLGLILCREFVEKSGGKLWFESEAGKGSTFRFTIPG